MLLTVVGMLLIATPVVASAQAPQPLPPPPAQAAPAPAQQAHVTPAPQPVYVQQPYVAQPYPPAAAPYYPPAPSRHRQIVGYRDVERTNVPVWASGLALFLAGWVLDFAIFTPVANAISTDRPQSVEEDSWAWSLVPIAGPWVQLALEAPHPAIPITMGLLQVAGVSMLIAGLVTSQSVRVPVYAGDPEDPSMRRLDVSAAPTLGGASLLLTYRQL